MWLFEHVCTHARTINVLRWRYERHNIGTAGTCSLCPHVNVHYLFFHSGHAHSEYDTHSNICIIISFKPTLTMPFAGNRLYAGPTRTQWECSWCLDAQMDVIRCDAETHRGFRKVIPLYFLLHISQPTNSWHLQLRLGDGPSASAWFTVIINFIRMGTTSWASLHW